MNFDDKELTELFCDVFGSEDISRPRGESIGISLVLFS